MNTKLVLAVTVLLFIAACANLEVAQSPQVCTKDGDCVCGGFDTVAQQCFVGNKNYHASAAVDKSKDCPDFCTGIGGNLVTKCVDRACSIVNKNTFPECNHDIDCAPSECCHSSLCHSRAKSPMCVGVLCTQSCVPGTLDCGGSCACEAHRCVTKNLFKGSVVPVV